MGLFQVLIQCQAKTKSTNSFTVGSSMCRHTFSELQGVLLSGLCHGDSGVCSKRNRKWGRRRGLRAERGRPASHYRDKTGATAGSAAPRHMAEGRMFVNRGRLYNCNLRSWAELGGRRLQTPQGAGAWRCPNTHSRLAFRGAPCVPCAKGRAGLGGPGDLSAGSCGNQHPPGARSLGHGHGSTFRERAAVTVPAPRSPTAIAAVRDHSPSWKQLCESLL